MLYSRAANLTLRAARARARLFARRIVALTREYKRIYCLYGAFFVVALLRAGTNRRAARFYCYVRRGKLVGRMYRCTRVPRELEERRLELGQVIAARARISNGVLDLRLLETPVERVDRPSSRADGRFMRCGP